MKKVKFVLIGAISLVIFGLLLPQPLQALLVIVDTPFKKFFEIHTVILCVIVGLTQGISEECGYYFVLKHILKKEQNENLSFWFGLGRSLLHTIFDIVIIIGTFYSNIWVFFFTIVARMFSFVAMMKLTILDYLSCKKKKLLYLVLSILFHAILNGILYASELQLIINFDIWFMIIYSLVIIIISSFIYKKELY